MTGRDMVPAYLQGNAPEHGTHVCVQEGRPVGVAHPSRAGVPHTRTDLHRHAGRELDIGRRLRCRRLSVSEDPALVALQKRVYVTLNEVVARLEHVSIARPNGSEGARR